MASRVGWARSARATWCRASPGTAHSELVHHQCPTPGHLPLDLAADVERLQRRLPTVCGPEPQPTLLHGDAQQNNFISTDTGAVVIDAAPYFGHPEIDLALVDYFQPVPDDVFDAYREITVIAPGFTERRELWRIFGYLAVVTVDGDNPFGRRFLRQLGDAIRRYR